MSVQSMEALAAANETRTAGMRYRHQLKALPRAEAFELCACLLEKPPAMFGSIQLTRLLMSLPRVGPLKVGRMLDECEIHTAAQVRPVRNLTLRQRKDLAVELRKRAAK